MVKKAAQGNSKTKKALRKKAPTQLAIRKSIQAKFGRRIYEGVKLARRLEKKNLSPDEIAASVRAKLEGLGGDIVSDVLRLVNGSIHVQI